MSILRRVFGASTLAASIGFSLMAEPSAEDFPAGGIVTTVNGVDGRLQLHYLPNEQDYNYTSGPDYFLRNPGGRQIILQDPLVQVGSNPANIEVRARDSIGPIDERQVASHADHEYDAVVLMIDSDGMPICTATIATIDGFDLRSAGTLISTAAHCIEYEGALRPAEDVFFVGSYFDYLGQYHEFALPADEIWINPLYEENILMQGRYYNDHGVGPSERVGADTALIYSSVQFPADIMPALIVPVDYVGAIDREREYADDIPALVTVVGHSSDKPYLTVHENAQIRRGTMSGIVSLADIVSGASGGPVFETSGEDNAPVLFDDNGQPVMIAVNAAIAAGTDIAYHAYYDPATLESVPFLRRPEMGEDEYCVQSGEVLASRLNIRVAPDVLAMALVPRGGQNPSPLTRGTLFNVVAMATNHLDEAWALVETERGYTGYIRADDSYVSLHPRTCYIR